MQGGKFELRLPIAPDSGTGELSGVTGQMTIEIVEGKHLYSIDYELGLAAHGRFREAAP